VKTPDQIAAETASAVAMANRLWIWIAFLSLFLALSLLSNVTLIYNAFWRMPIKAFLWTSDGAAVCEAIPLTEPSVSQARLKDLAASAAVGLNSYDYANWRKLIDNQLTQYFTARGREQYKQALFASGIVEKVVQNYQTVSAVTSDAVNIAEEGRIRGRYYWKIEVPLQVFYKTNAETKRENRLLTMTVVRVDPSPINPNGIAIDGLVSTQLLVTQGVSP